MQRKVEEFHLLHKTEFKKFKLHIKHNTFKIVLNHHHNHLNKTLYSYDLIQF